MTCGVCLFLVQIFVSILKGEIMKNVSLDPTDKTEFRFCISRRVWSRLWSAIHDGGGRAPMWPLSIAS